MSKIVRSPRNMKTSGRRPSNSGYKKPFVGKIQQEKKSIEQILKDKKPGHGLDNYSLDLMILE